MISFSLKRVSSVILISFLVLGLLAPPIVAAQEEIKSISGKVLTNAEEPVANLTVTLNEHRMGSFTLASETATDDTGTYVFPEIDSEKMYFIEFNYEGVKYSEFVDFSRKRFDFTVYESTTSDEDVGVIRHSIVVSGHDSELHITEILDFRNNGDLVINNSNLELSIPQEKSNLKLSTMGRSYEFEDHNDHIAFKTVSPIAPGGEFNVAAEYTLPLEGEERSIDIDVSYDTESLIFFVDEREGIEAEDGEGTMDNGYTTEGGMSYHMFPGGSLKAGSSVEISIKKVASGVWDTVTILLAIPMVIIIGILFSYPLLVNKNRSKKGRIERLEEKKNSLFSKIIVAETRHKVGEISKEELEKIRSKQKRKIMDLMEEIDELKG
ncbi:MAG: carboxypeptidase-like regulatory domain-containing protein [Halobacteriota archaeon]|nr:carboxypeptidase-like regulatory domain-containing protein [Halobacteriota archaeon]